VTRNEYYFYAEINLVQKPRLNAAFGARQLYQSSEEGAAIKIVKVKSSNEKQRILFFRLLSPGILWYPVPCGASEAGGERLKVEEEKIQVVEEKDDSELERDDFRCRHYVTTSSTKCVKQRDGHCCRMNEIEPKQVFLQGVLQEGGIMTLNGFAPHNGKFSATLATIALAEACNGGD